MYKRREGKIYKEYIKGVNEKIYIYIKKYEKRK